MKSPEENQLTPGQGLPAPDSSRVDLRPEVDFSTLPLDVKATFKDGIALVIESGAMIEVWDIEGGGYHFRIRRPLDDGRQSVLKFSLSGEATEALCGLLSL